MKKCPFCSQDVQDDALVCPHCGGVLTPSVATGPATPDMTPAGVPAPTPAPSPTPEPASPAPTPAADPSLPPPPQFPPAPQPGQLQQVYQQTYQAGMGVPKTNGSAIAAMVCAIVGILVFGIILGAVALILGLVSLNQINKSGGMQKGKGMALTGIILGPIDVVAAIVILNALLNKTP